MIYDLCFISVSLELSEGHLVVRGCGLSCGLHGLCYGLASRLLLAREHLHIVYPNLYYGTAYAILIIIRTAMDATLYIELVALAHILLHCLC